MKIIKKNVGEEYQIIDTDMKYIGELKKYIGTEYYPESCPISSTGLMFCVDEDGYLKELERNIFVPTINRYYPVQRLVGTVVFYRQKPVDMSHEIYDYEIDELTDQDIELCKKILSDNEQKKYEQMYDILYGSTEDYIKPIIETF